MDMPHILVADDNRVNLFFLRRVLEKAGYRIISAHDGQEAVEATLAHDPAILLLDISMPRMDGVAAFEEIKRQRPGQDLPAVAVTANDTTRQREACAAAGFDEFIAKPVPVEALLAVVERLLAERSDKSGTVA